MSRRVSFVVGLVVIFFVSYQAAARNRAVVAESGSMTWLLLLPLVFVVLFVVFLWLQMRGMSVINRACFDINEGRVSVGLNALEPLKNRNNAVVHYYRGLGMMSLWKLDEAVELFETALRHRAAEHVRLFAEPQLALARALRGDALNGPVGDTSLAPTRLAEAVRKLRSGSWNDAIAAMNVDSIRPLSGRDRAVAEALRAWALTERGEATPVFDRVGVLGEADFNAVRKYWPQFAAFLER